MPSTDTHKTHKAALYYVASNLIRKGFSLSEIHNKAKPNIIAKKDDRDIRINVKGLSNQTVWLFDKKTIKTADFYILLSFDKKLDNLEKNPELYILPLCQIESNVKSWEDGFMGIELVKINAEFRNAWNLLGSL